MTCERRFSPSFYFARMVLVTYVLTLQLLGKLSIKRPARNRYTVPANLNRMATFMNESIIIGSDRGTSRGPWPGVAFALAVALVGLGAWAFFGDRVAPTPVPVLPPAATSTPATSTPVITTAKLALLDASGEGGGEAAGCDTLAFVEVPVATTTDAAAAALAALFSGATTTDLMPGNFVGDQDDLTFESAGPHDADYHVYLEGSVAYAGVCDDPRLEIQVEQTVRANRAVAGEVEIFLNGEAYEAPNEKGE